MSWFAELVDYELHRAREKFPEPIHSLHEGYAVIKEELDEFWEEVKKQDSERNNDRLLEEIVQVAAMCQRVAEDELGNAVERSYYRAIIACHECYKCLYLVETKINPQYNYRVNFACNAPGLVCNEPVVIDLFVESREGSPGWCPLKG
jgi:hypothetical protein